ncbi:cytochrome C [Dyadobacter flavalbus]|uniref:Cytochrome C n=1 Tax=Dyadobacter flavalbus TaxID=2579942 RepID=A0A5M8R122_9BACT|nr:c-type cytochrome domain-containing protein [Dyadobacter flavalbus]KAA6441321.1 cytochrome C [Dyadobacter flavalbus]
MHSKFRTFAGQLLIASQIFILFLLLFENKLVIPAWLQTIGRMHPLILHFPIVILLLAMLLEFFSFRPEYAKNPFYRNFLHNLLLAGSLLAAVTVIMGLFLSKEEGYEGEILTYHKWTGVGIFFFASFIYFIRNSSWYKAPVAKAGSLLTVAALVVTGHYGAALTHGMNFIWEPIESTKEAAAVSPDEAIVFTHIVQPILEQKCTSCHNPDKMKGQLSLTDAQSLLKGGKSGKLLVPGNPEISLLLQRIHLPNDEKKHMPPIGKPQLTPQETAILNLWIKDQAKIDKKLASYPENDSLRFLAAAYLRPAGQMEAYDFEPADEDEITALNSDYRTIVPVAKNSPALAVNIYNRATYTSRQLNDLESIRKQVISLNLNKLPVKDADLEIIGKFENLQRLNLNFTEISAGGLKALTGLKNLSSLAISGTKIKYGELSALLPAFKNLKTVSVWNTPLSEPEIAQLQKANGNLAIIGGFKDDGKNMLRLNPPQMKNSSPVFAGTMALQLKHPINGVEIRYTMDGSEPDSVKSPLVSDKMLLTKSENIKAKAFKNGWYGSETVQFDVYKSSLQPDSVQLLAPLNRVHQATGAKTFFDRKLGVIGANNPAWANNWAAVKDNDMILVSEFKKPALISSVGIHYMIEEDTGIFPPETVEVWGGKDAESMKLLSKFQTAMPAKGDKPSLKTMEGKFKPQTVSCLKIVAKPLNKIPEWHKNKGGKALLLVDEMFLN